MYTVNNFISLPQLLIMPNMFTLYISTIHILCLDTCICSALSPNFPIFNKVKARGSIDNTLATV